MTFGGPGQGFYNPQTGGWQLEDPRLTNPNRAVNGTGIGVGQNEKLVYEQMADLVSGKSSVAQQQMYKGLGAANQAMQAQAVGRGANPLGERAAILQGGQNMRNSVADAAALRAQEMQAATAAVRGDMRFGQEMEMQRAQFAAQQAQQQLENERRAQSENGYGQAVGNALGTLGQAAGMGAMMSDVRNKTDLAPIPGPAQDALIDRLQLQSYRYSPDYAAVAGIPPEIRQQPRLGVMAQDLAGTPAAVETPNGLGIDKDQALSTTMGLVGRLGERIDQLEHKPHGNDGPGGLAAAPRASLADFGGLSTGGGGPVVRRPLRRPFDATPKARAVDRFNQMHVGLDGMDDGSNIAPWSDPVRVGSDGKDQSFYQPGPELGKRPTAPDARKLAEYLDSVLGKIGR
jgi:hypothetical protein